VKDEKLRMVLCNAAHARSVGKTPEETYGKTDIENGWSADLVKGKTDKASPDGKRTTSPPLGKDRAGLRCADECRDESATSTR